MVEFENNDEGSADKVSGTSIEKLATVGQEEAGELYSFQGNIYESIVE